MLNLEAFHLSTKPGQVQIAACHTPRAISGNGSNGAPLQKLAATALSWASITWLPRMRSTVSFALAELPLVLVRTHTAQYSICSVSASAEPTVDLGGAICASRILEESGK